MGRALDLDLADLQYQGCSDSEAMLYLEQVLQEERL